MNTQQQLVDTYVRNGIRMFDVTTANGFRYDIPEVWAMGYCRTHGGDALDAAAAWIEQAEMERGANA